MGTCDGGPDAKCNCDLEDGETRQDGGFLVHKDRLPVCEVCVSLDPLSSLNISPKIRRVQPVVTNLICDANPVGKYGLPFYFKKQTIKQTFADDKYLFSLYLLYN